ncbi:MAG: histidine kinase dimerization/phospho-acceptor domain-containing protein [Gemmatimonadales bacterium]|jgi:signal transduction histidine kinase
MADVEKEGRGEAQLERLQQAVSHIRHEVGTPLTAIMAEVELLLMDADQLNAEQTRSVEAIGAMARRIRDLVAQLHEITSDD